MNLFCFTLEGSTESIYEPAYSHTLKEVLPSYPCSPLPRREWAGSDPSVHRDPTQSAAKPKRNNRRSCVAASSLDNETIEKDINHACWMSSGDRKDLSHQKEVQNTEMCKAADDSEKELNSGRTQTDPRAQDDEDAAATESTVTTSRGLKKLQKLVQGKKRHQSGCGSGKSTCEDDDADTLSNSNPVLTCIGLGRRAEKKPPKSPPPQTVKDVQDEAERPGDRLWSPFDCSQPWTPFYHTCNQPGHELWVCGGTMSLPRATEWDRFESLIRELDSKQSDLSPTQMIRSITDLHLTQGTLTRFGRFGALRQHSPLMKPQDNGSSLPQQNGEAPGEAQRPKGKEIEDSSCGDRRAVKATPQKTLTAITSGETPKNEARKTEVGGGRTLNKGHKISSNSLESLYSRQSSSSGVTSGSDCSSNRGSLRLEDELLCARQFCGRARVHTEFVPSPYDTESLKLKVGDVIDIIHKPPMGIWTGMLNNRVGNFKFIYVDVLTESSPEPLEEMQNYRARQKCRSTVHEVLKRLSLEEYSSSLQLNGYQTVDDLMRLKEHHLTQLNVTDPEHRHRLLAAVESLQQLCSNCHTGNAANQEAKTPGENMKADTNNGPRDSGCHMTSDSPDNSGEDADLQFSPKHPMMTVS